MSSLITPAQPLDAGPLVMRSQVKKLRKAPSRDSTLDWTHNISLLYYIILRGPTSPNNVVGDHVDPNHHKNDSSKKAHILNVEMEDVTVNICSATLMRDPDPSDSWGNNKAHRIDSRTIPKCVTLQSRNRCRDNIVNLATWWWGKGPSSHGMKPASFQIQTEITFAVIPTIKRSSRLFRVCLGKGIANEPLGAKGPPLVGEEVRKEDVGKVETKVDKFQPSHRLSNRVRPAYLMSHINWLKLQTCDCRFNGLRWLAIVNNFKNNYI